MIGIGINENDFLAIFMEIVGIFDFVCSAVSVNDRGIMLYSMGDCLYWVYLRLFGASRSNLSYITK